ncbi:MAG: group II intron reverse transcriptase domain-containing protein [Kouleothrix sp.]|jgi:retron-type reverse transcriptase|nr:group II intron reverse transcriptase domain-containing protein [Kouleothrix sp.]
MPKSYRHLWPRLVSFENLHTAWRNARRGKRGLPAVASFDIVAEDMLFELQAQLEQDTYRPGRYASFRLVENGKRRMISAAPFRDRVVHHALCQVIEPIFEARFHAHSYACRVGKGTHRAIRRCQELSRCYRYVLQCDVQQFFPSIDHEVLRTVLRRHIADSRVQWLIDTILDGGKDVLREEYRMVYFPGDDLFAATRPRGLPIGNLTSQFWANCYLHPLDLFIAQELHCTAYVRYCDDFLLFADEKATLHRWRSAVVERLASLRLTLHEARAQVFPARTGIPWLGWVVYPTHRLLKRRCGVALARRLRASAAQVRAGQLPLEQLTNQVRCWVAHAECGDTYGLRRAALTAFYTPLPVVRVLWEAIAQLGFRNVPSFRMLEPAAGIGNIISAMPPQLRALAQITAIELEPLSARMLGHIHPDITLYAGKGFQDVNLPEHRFDLAISNVPFGDVGVADHFKKRLMRCYRYSLTAKS